MSDFGPGTIDAHDPGWDLTYTLANGRSVVLHITSHEVVQLLLAAKGEPEEMSA